MMMPVGSKKEKRDLLFASESVDSLKTSSFNDEEKEYTEK